MLGMAIAMGGAAAVTFAPVASAQDYTSGGITGTVYDNTGAPVSGQTVSLKSVDRGFTRDAVTDASGTYRFTRLPIGNYQVGVSGGASDTIRVAVGTNARKDLAVSGSVDEIVASGTIVKAFDFEAATTGLTIDIDETFTKTPLPRSLAAATLLTPGATGGDSRFGNLVSIGGSSVAENVYYVNGMNVTDFRNFIGSGTVPFEFYEQIQTKSGGLPAEFGRTTGGVSNAVTRSGTNEWHFGASVYHENDKLRSSQRDLVDVESGNVITDRSSSKIDSTEYNLWASGPIVEDRIFAYALYSPRSYESFGRDPVSGETVTFVRDNPFYGGKLDVVVTDDHLLEFTGWRNYSEGVTTSVRASSPDPIVGIAKSGGDIWSAKYTGTFTDWLTVSAMYGEQENDKTTSSAADVFPAIYDNRIRSNGFVNIGQHASFIIETGNDKRKLFRADADVYVDDFFGDHHFRLGFDREELTAQQTAINSGGIYYLYDDDVDCDSRRATPTGESCLRIRTYSNGGSFDVNTTAFYLQDAWEVTDNLTLNLGIRNEQFENLNATGDVFIDIKNQWQPRLSFAYQPDFDADGTLFGSYSRYYLPVAANTNIRSAGAETFIHRYYEYTGMNADNTPIYDPATLFSTTTFSDGTAPEPDSLVDRNLKPQNMDEFVVGYSTSLDGKVGGELANWNVGLAVTHTNLNRVIEDISIDQGVIAYCADNNITGCENFADPGHPVGYVLTNPGNDVDVVVDLPGGAQRVTLTAEQLGYPKAKRKYTGVEFKFDRVVEDDPLELHGSWTISNSKGNYEGSVKSDNGQDDAGLTTDFDFPALMEHSYGFLPNHRKHKFKMYGSYELTDAVSVGANLQVTSPRKFGCLGQHPDGTNFNNYGRSWFCGGQPTPRGSQLESDWSKTLDMNVSFEVPEFSLGTLTLWADVCI